MLSKLAEEIRELGESKAVRVYDVRVARKFWDEKKGQRGGLINQLRHQGVKFPMNSEYTDFNKLTKVQQRAVVDFVAARLA